MTEDQARKLEVPIKWNSKANVCVYCGRVPETFYVVTGHDHTDDSIRWCICREAGQYKDEITTLRQRVAELEKERDELKLVVSAHADFFSSTQSEMADLKESVECLSATNDFLIGKRDENIILKAAVKQLTAERDELNNIAENIGDLHHVTLDEWAAMKAERDVLKQQRDELLAAAEAIETDADECLDFDECTAMLVPIDTHHKLMEAIASVKETK